MRLSTLLVLLFATSGTMAQDEARPNVLLITIDDLNDWVGCLGGHTQVRTPHIDALAKRGLLFTNAHCQAPVCNPSRVSFMTGRRPSSTGVYLNNDRFRSSPVLKNAVTLPEHFAQHGYRTFGVGKLFHASKETTCFQRYGPSLGQGPLPKTKLNCPKKQSRSRLWDWGPFPAEDSQTHDVISARWGAGVMTEEHAKPWFLGVGFYRPHVPLYAPVRWFENYPVANVALPVVLSGDRSDIPKFGLQLTDNPLPPSHAWFVRAKQWKPAVQAYLACTEFVDHCVGIVIESLDKSVHRDNTWIVLLSDHGFHLGEKQRWAKQSLWERSTRVPFIVVPPKSRAAEFPPGKCNQPVELLDIYPTLLEVCKAGCRPELEGRSLVPLLKDPTTVREQPAITTYQRDNHAVRSQSYRYIRYSDGSEELYDHSQDRGEHRNLAGDATFRHVILAHRKWLPKVNHPAVSVNRK